MDILGIETSCDETGIAIVRDGTKILANVTATSADLHSVTGGIIPESAAREQVKVIIPTLSQSLTNAKLKLTQVDALAVTHGPGLIGSLLVGVETAKALSFATGLPLIPVNHLYGHLYAAWLDNLELPVFPFIALIVSGGHTDILHVKDHGQIDWLGGTRDDAAGEAFDKTARALGLGYPGGPIIAQRAKEGQALAEKLPRPMASSGDFDFSFSGLKTAVYYQVRDQKLTDTQINDYAFEIQEAITDLLVQKTTQAASHYQVNQIIIGGGVAANQRLKEKMTESFRGAVIVPPPSLCTDNGAMIASAAFFQNHPVPWDQIKTDPNLHY